MVQLKGSEASKRGQSFSTGQFRVEEFRLPVLEGRVTPSEKKALIYVKAVPTDLQINHVAGGGAVHLPVRVPALVHGKALGYSDYEDFSFSPPRGKTAGSNGGRGEGEEETTPSQDQRVIADKLPVTLDKTAQVRSAQLTQRACGMLRLMQEMPAPRSSHRVLRRPQKALYLPGVARRCVR